jgi:NAD(P)-dependent dehydrogenase (short-subunit alcohol dehydrogenase family)
VRPDIGAVQADAGEEAAIDDMFKKAERHLGGLLVLINNSLDVGRRHLAHRLGEDLPATDQFVCARRAIPLMKTQKFDSIVDVSRR